MTNRHLARVACISFALGGAVAAQEAKVPPAALDSIDRAVRELAKKGRSEEAFEAISILQALGLGQPEAHELVRRANQDLARAKKSKGEKVPRAASLLRSAASRLSEHLAAVEDPASKAALARAILRLDDTDAAHEALGDVRVGPSWVSALEPVMRERRAAFSAARTAARRLEVTVEAGVSEHPVLRAIRDEPAAVVSWGGTRVHGSASAPELARILREALRACALVRYLLDGELALPTVHERDWLLLDSKDLYLKAVDEAIASGGITGVTAANARDLGGFFDGRGHCVLDYSLEPGVITSLFCYFSWSMKLGRGRLPDLRDTQACLISGLQNLVAMSYLGWHLPEFASIDMVEFGSESLSKRSSEVPLDEDARLRREEIFRMAKAGLVGCRTFVAYLAEHGEDPPYRAAMVDEPHHLVGVELMKATLVAECFVEKGALNHMFMRTRPELATERGMSTVELFEEAIGESLGDFERRWREWIVPARGSLVERVGAPTRRGDDLTRDQQSLLDHLNGIRERALGSSLDDEPVGLDRELSDGAARHALYLAKNPSQAEAWPDAHEEYADAAGFSPEGAWAGGHAVIAPGSRSGVAAIDSWMGTFYHRIPLLESGLMKVGFALEKGYAVMDTNSLRLPTEPRSYLQWNRGAESIGTWLIRWPHDGMRDVPTRFEPELPNPVPGEDQGDWGYPITVSFPWKLSDVAVEISLSLHEGSEAGEALECWLSTPDRPTNIEIAPSLAWCLIPKQRLRAKSAYTVIAVLEFVGGGIRKTERSVWSFRT